MTADECRQENGVGAGQRPPGERAARAVLALFRNLIWFVRLIVGSTGATRPAGQVLHYRPPPGRKAFPARFSRILIVEDNQEAARKIALLFQEYYQGCEIRIFLAYGMVTAENFFDRERIQLVVMDYDLNEEHGTGADLTSVFRSRRPDVPILANSNSSRYNRRLMAGGAGVEIGKNLEKLRQWLQAHDPPASD